MDKELIIKARQANLPLYLLHKGVPLVPNGSRYKHSEHDSLTFTENAYFWNSRQEHGNAIDYLVRHMGMDFVTAVAELTQFSLDSEQTQKFIIGFKESDLIINSDNSKVIDYLTKVRYIGFDIVDYLVGKCLLFQEDKTNNVVFPMYDENNIMVGAELQGITAKRFKGVAKGSKYGYGFNVRFSADDIYDYALFFESAVDLVSFIDYKRNHDKKPLDKCIFVSMAGLKQNIFLNMLKCFKGKMTPVLCVDNDEAGRKFISEVECLGVSHGFCIPDERFKDWNEQVKGWRSCQYLFSP